MPDDSVEIQNLDDQGFGKTSLFLADGTPRDLFVPFSLPGEVVKTTRPFKKRGLRFAEALQIDSPSPNRILPFCSHFGICGGCTMQHLDYSEELLWKEKRVRDLFARLTDLQVQPIIPSPLEKGWRGKMEYTFSSKGLIGLHRMFGKRQVFDLRECPIGPQWFAEATEVMRNFIRKTSIMPFDSYSTKGSLRTLTLRHGFRTNQRMLCLTVSGNPDYAWTRAQIEALKDVLAPLALDSLFLIIQQAIKGRPTQFFEIQLGEKGSIEEVFSYRGTSLTFQISPRAFFQPNPLQAEKLYEKVIDMLELNGKEVVYDLFAGTATFGLFAALKASRVFALEISKEACVDARVNRILNQIDHLDVIEGDVGKILKEGKLPKPDSVVIDPPRSGLTPLAKQALIDLNPKNIVYVSCNPATQVADVESMVEAGWSIAEISPIDQFPRTRHIENIVKLRR